MSMRAITLALCACLASGHGSLLFPLPRGGLDKVLPDFANGSQPGAYTCECTNGTNAVCDSAQSCLWFNLENAVDNNGGGIWLPLGQYGAARIDWED